MFSDRQRQTPEQPSLPSNEIVIQASKKGEDERGAMGGRRSRPLRSVGNTQWKETYVYNPPLERLLTKRLQNDFNATVNSSEESNLAAR